MSMDRRTTGIAMVGLLVGGMAVAGAATLVPGDDPEHPRVRYAGGSLSLNDRCPLRHGKLNPGVDPVYVNGRPVAFCCKPCPKKFARDPQLYLEQLGIEVACVVEPDTRAILDVEHRVFVNHETYFLSSDAALAAFRADPLRYVGTLTDPVTGARFAPDADSPVRVFEDRTYFFASADTRVAFEMSPQAYALPDRERAG